MDRFNAVADRNVIDFEAWFTDRTADDRAWQLNESEWRFKYRYLKKVTLAGKSVSPLPLSILFNPPDLIVGFYAGPVYIVGLILARMRGSSVALWCLLTFETWNARQPWKERLKHLLFAWADGVFTIGPDSSEYALSYGTSRDHIHVVQQAFDVAHYSSNGTLREQNREARRTALGLKGTTFIYAGRLWKGKGLDNLFDAFGIAQRQSHGEMSLLIVGDGLLEEHLRTRRSDEALANVIFGGYIQKSELPLYYAASDVFVFPTLGDPYGLVVDEALASSLPVISTDAAGEIRERILDNHNGFVVPVGDVRAFAEKMILLAEDQCHLDELSLNAYPSICDRTPERWSKEFEHAVTATIHRSRH